MFLLKNPVALIFLSYTIGALLTSVLNATGLIRYFYNRNFISDKWTKNLGVLHFGWLVKNTFMRLFNNKVYLKNKRDKESLKMLIKESTNAEVGHLIGFVSLLIVNIYIFFAGDNFIYALVLMLINIIFNLYLVFLQQYNKRRVKRLLP